MDSIKWEKVTGGYRRARLGTYYFRLWGIHKCTLLVNEKPDELNNHVIGEFDSVKEALAEAPRAFAVWRLSQ